METKRKIRTWRVGEVGREGTRLVEPDGCIIVCGRRYYNDRLLRHVGEIVFFHDDDGDVSYGEGYDKPRFSVEVMHAVWHANGMVSGQPGGKYSDDGGVTWKERPYIGRAWERTHNPMPKYRENRRRRRGRP